MFLKPNKCDIHSDHSTDRTILIWYLKDLSTTKDRKTFRINVEFDHVYKVTWSPDTKALVGFKAMGNAIEVYRVDRKEGVFFNYAKGITFSRYHENDDVVNMDIASNGKFIMTASNKTDLVLWDVRGNVLEHLNTFTMTNYSARISPCGRYVGVSGYAPDVKFWEVKFDKNGSYEKTVRAFELVGHQSGVWDFAFDSDSSHVATVCKNGTWKLFDIQINYTLGESPKCLLTGEYESKAVSPLIALSNSAHVIAIASGSNVQLFSGLTGELDETIENIFNDHIMAIGFDSLSAHLYVLGDRQIRIFHNVTKYKVEIVTAREKLKDAKSSMATRERLEEQIHFNEEFLFQFN